MARRDINNMNEQAKQVIEEVLDKGFIMNIAFHDFVGTWSCVVNYISDEDYNLYWISSPEVRHSKAIAENPQFAGTVTVSEEGEDNLGIQFSGIAEKIDTPPVEIVARYFTKRGKEAPGEGVDFLKGRSWYVLRPRHIDVISQKLWGFKKEKVNL